MSRFGAAARRARLPVVLIVTRPSCTARRTVLPTALRAASLSRSSARTRWLADAHVASIGDAADGCRRPEPRPRSSAAAHVAQFAGSAVA